MRRPYTLHSRQIFFTVIGARVLPTARRPQVDQNSGVSGSSTSCPSPKPHPLRSWMVHARAGQREVRARLTHVRAQRTCSKRWRLVGGRGVGILRLSGLPGETRFSAEDGRRERREERRARVGGGED